jgi:hypothetical protein
MVYVNATESSGHGPFTLGTAVTGFQTAAAAGITNGTPVSYKATDGTNWETAHGVIDVSGSTYTLTRGVDTINSSNSNALVNFGSGVVVLLTPLSQDINALLSAGATQSFNSTQKTQIFKNMGPHNTSQQTEASGNQTTTSASTVMCGCKFTFTPVRTGTLLIMMPFNSACALGYTNVTLGYYGTGTPPNAGGAATGTQFGNAGVTASTGLTNGAIFGVLSGLTIGTAYWFDLGFYTQSGTGATSYLDNMVATFIEL